MPIVIFTRKQSLFIILCCLLRVKRIHLHDCKQGLCPFEQVVMVIIVKVNCPWLHYIVWHIHSHPPTACLTVKAERTPRSERKRRDSFGMYDGYESCSEESTSSSSSEDSDDEVVPSIPASLPIIKNNGQVYTYPDGKAGMGESWMGTCNFCFLCPSILLQSCEWQQFAKCKLDRVKMSHLFFSPQPRARCVEWWVCGMLFTPKQSASAACRVRGVIPPIPKRPASWRDCRWVLSCGCRVAS